MLIMFFVLGLVISIYPCKSKNFETTVVKNLPKEVEYILKIDINKADISELQQLEGIGKTIAERIVEYREGNGKFNNLDDLLRVKGIGKKTFNKIRYKVKI